MKIGAIAIVLAVGFVGCGARYYAPPKPPVVVDLSAGGTVNGPYLVDGQCLVELVSIAGQVKRQNVPSQICDDRKLIIAARKAVEAEVVRQQQQAAADAARAAKATQTSEVKK